MTFAPRNSRLLTPALLVPLLLLAAGAAHATVVEPNGLRVPQPLTTMEVTTAAQTNPLAPLVSLDALFQARGETVQWQNDAQKKPDTFSPVCGFTAELVLRGGGCAIDFGWYNVVPGHMPLDSEIFPLITAAQIMALPVMAFMPGAGQDGPTFNASTILNSPNYMGGLIGFATRGATGTACTQTHFSQQSLNLLCTNCTMATDGDNHWIASLIYKSTVDPNGYYVAFEDLPMTPTSFAGTGQYTNDGDMNDFVFFVTGVTCPGGGRACTTTMQGVCRDGINECQGGGALVCRPAVTPSPEKCDGLDNDCNGMVDEGDNLCPHGQFCSKGQCVGPCGDLEFPCAAGLICDNGYCVDPQCVSMTCPAGQVCRNGACRGPCDGIMCPLGQVCRVGRCVDPCAGVTCDADRVCRGGACVQKCQCLACDVGLACEMSSGRCVPTGCENKTCAAGEVCDAGDCVDACQKAICPTGQKCEAGNCVDLPPAASGTGGSGTSGAGGVSGGSAGGNAGGAAGAGGSGVDGGAVDGSAPPVRRTPPSCRCELDAGAPGPGAMALTVSLLALARMRRRRARR